MINSAAKLSLRNHNWFSWLPKHQSSMLDIARVLQDNDLHNSLGITSWDHFLLRKHVEGKWLPRQWTASDGYHVVGSPSCVHPARRSNINHFSLWFQTITKYIKGKEACFSIELSNWHGMTLTTGNMMLQSSIYATVHLVQSVRVINIM